MRISRIIPILALIIVTTTLNVDAQCKAFAKRFASLNWEHIHMMETIMLLYLLKVKRLNSIKLFIPIWNTGYQFAERINFRR